MSRSQSCWMIALMAGLVGCAPRSRIETIEGQVTVRPEHCAWAPIDPARPEVFDGSAGLEVREGVGVAVDFSAFWYDERSQLDEFIDGPWTVVVDDPSVVEPFSAPNNTIGLIAHAPGEATLTLTLIGHPGSFDVPVAVVAALDFEPNPPSSGGSSATGSGGSGGSAAGAGGGL